MNPEYRNTADGSGTLYLPEMNEQYHSLNGAVTESKHVFIEMGYRFHSAPNPVIFEVGFGTGLNCLLTADLAEKDQRSVFYIAIEKYPLSSETIKKLDYGRFIQGKGRELFSSIHECVWDVPVQLTPWFTLLKLKADFTGNEWQIPQHCDIIYFDAFGPDKQPEMWSLPNFLHLSQLMSPGGVFVTYSAKGMVRRQLTEVGFTVERLPGPPGKKEMLRGIKTASGI
ncbi:SAM-dependent methyltransferase [Mariniphaga sediminis]|jgi:tRNA U34 5-methylaminomethyl-2-thiouridine-forming methyltransferase MnmC|uniref:SAM-dependent methyltransferase n=1 Tax=Mariniphaga sediminis TaxID=1628158 RepID=A0A399CTE6_9BACT|nr:tRNA (5-methylaminomethyl-2-thiouridine)(34)-methyltransferase MnmD [Mariniphaga sediminis]RIH63205.1 SAM-dependent methyltransferase [Mariniphaga sediminis]